MNKISTAPQIQPATERRKSLRLIQYWEEIRNGRALPSESDIDPDTIADIWDNCFLIQVRDMGRGDGNFTYLGKNILDAFRGGLTGDSCGGIVSPNIRNLGQNFTEILTIRQPLLQEGRFQNVLGDAVRFRQSIIPLGYQEDTVDAIFGCMTLKVFHYE